MFNRLQHRLLIFQQQNHYSLMQLFAHTVSIKNYVAFRVTVKWFLLVPNRIDLLIYLQPH